MTWPSSGQSRNVLLPKTETPLRCRRWWSGLTIVLHCGGYWLQSPPVGVRSQDRWEGKNVSAVIETISCPILLYLWEVLNQSPDRVAQTPLKWCIWCLNVAASMGLRSFCPWWFKLGGNTETISTCLKDVHYRLAIVCDICWLFTSMPVHVVLECPSGCGMKLHKKFKTKEKDEAS